MSCRNECPSPSASEGPGAPRWRSGSENPYLYSSSGNSTAAAGQADSSTQNTQLSADFVASTVKELRKSQDCPIV